MNVFQKIELAITRIPETYSRDKICDDTFKTTLKASN